VSIFDKLFLSKLLEKNRTLHPRMVKIFTRRNRIADCLAGMIPVQIRLYIALNCSQISIEYMILLECQQHSARGRASCKLEMGKKSKWTMEPNR